MGKIAVLIPAYNEEDVIGKTLKSLNPIVDPKDIFVLSDSSTDDTGKIVREYGVNHTRSRERKGKTSRLQSGMKKYSINSKYEFVFILDADTRPKKDYFKKALARFDDPKVACVCGQVETEAKFNLFVAYRGLMYFVWQNLYKRICSKINAVTIAPGTASLYRTSAFKKIKLDRNIIIEDFDMTYQIYRKDLGRIVYEPDAVVVTQDPDNLKDYFTQTTRWQLGFFQTAKKHKIPFGGKPFELALLYFTVQEVAHSIFLLVILPLSIWLTFFALYPSIFGIYLEYREVLYILGFEILLVSVFSLVQVLFTRSFVFVPFIPFLWLLQYIHIGAFFVGLYQTIFKSISGAWNSAQRR